MNSIVDCYMGIIHLLSRGTYASTHNTTTVPFSDRTELVAASVKRIPEQIMAICTLFLRTFDRFDGRVLLRAQRAFNVILVLVAWS